MPRLAIMYGLDLVILLLAIGAALAANRERDGRPVPRGRLLLPGGLGFLGTVILLAYPDIRDLANPELWSIGAVGVAIGAVRGGLMAIDSDQAYGLAKLHHGGDGAWVAWAMVLFAAIQGSIEVGLAEENPYETSAELLMLLSSGYLLGRSIVTWLRARELPHLDLREE
jgi:hypothetical protein